jgi:uroporphyrin-III C-methyltransferase
LQEIAGIYAQLGKGQVPAAIIQNGTLPSQKIGVGVAQDLPVFAEEQGLKNPAIIVIGEVVRFHEAFQELQTKLADNYKLAV